MTTRNCIKGVLQKARGYLADVKRQELLSALSSEEIALMVCNIVKQRRSLLKGSKRVYVRKNIDNPDQLTLIPEGGE